jgi:phosphatidate cytidylyltransferase
MSNLLQRTLTGTVYVILILAAIIIHPLGFKLFTLLVNLFALLEFRRIGIKIGVPVSGIWILINMIVMFLVLLMMQTGWDRQFLILPAIVLMLGIFTLSIYQKNGNPVLSASLAIYGSLLITMPLLLLNLVHEISERNTIPFTLALFIFIWTNDTFAYLAGMSFGRHKLFPRITPKKSWEGFAGGVTMTLVAGIIMHRLFADVGLINWLIIAGLTAIASVFGDFSESLLKRIADIKDSGTLLPGHGGILDRIDSLLFAAPVNYIYLIILYASYK